MLSLESIEMGELLVRRREGLSIFEPFNGLNGTEQIKVNHCEMLCKFNSRCFYEGLATNVMVDVI